MGKKHLQYGFFTDDWNDLAAYKIVVKNPVLDLPDAWKTLGSHRFAHAYYMGILYEFYGNNYILYNITNQLLKALSAFTLFPVIYLLFKSRLLATLTAFFYVIHPSPYGALDIVSRGEDFIAVIFINLFLTIYILASQTKTFSWTKLSLLLIFLIAIGFFAPSRTYPVLLMLPLLELFNFWLNRPSANLGANILRLAFFYSPFIVVFLFSPGSILAQVGYYKSLWEMLKIGNFQLLLIPFASFGSTFIQPQLISSLFGVSYYSRIEHFITTTLLNVVIIFGFFYIVIAILINKFEKKFIFQTLIAGISISLLAYTASNHWLYLDNKFRASVDPGVFLIPALVGIFILSLSVSLLTEWLKDKNKDRIILGLSLCVVFSFLYIFLTWILSDVNSIFMGIHAYLNIPTMGTSFFMATILYLIYKRVLKSHRNKYRSILAKITLIVLIVLVVQYSTKSIDQYFSYGLENGFAAEDQERMRTVFWNEIGREKKFNLQNPALIYLDGFQDSSLGMYYENGLVWRIPAYLLVETGETLATCDLIMYKVDIKEIKVKIINGKKGIYQERCGSNLVYPSENFFAFRLINRDIIPIKSEILKKIGIE